MVCLASHGRSRQVFRLPRHQWIDVWRYPIAATTECEDSDLMWSMIRSKDYQYSFVAPWPDPSQDGLPVHGPYWVADLSPASFVPCDQHEVRRAIEHVIKVADDTLSLDDLRLDDVLGETLAAATTYKLDSDSLTPIDPAIGGILAGFNECVIVDRRRMVLTDLIVGGD